MSASRIAIAPPALDQDRRAAIARRVAAGFLAGASIVFGLLVLLLLLLISGGVWDLVREVAFQSYLLRGDLPVGRIFGTAVLRSAQTIPAYFWSARWAFLVLGTLGMVLALVDGWQARIARPWRHKLGFVVDLGILTALVVGLLCAYEQFVHGMVADDPTAFNQQEHLLVSRRTMIFFAVLLAFVLAYLTWIAWSWWFDYWAVWLGVRRTVRRRGPRPGLVGPAYLQAQERIAHNKQETHWLQPAKLLEPPVAPTPESEPRAPVWLAILLGAFLAATLLIVPLFRHYDRVGPRIISGEMWLSASARDGAVTIPFPVAPRHIGLSLTNSAGGGTVELVFRSNAHPTPLRRLENLPLPGSPGRYQTATLDVGSLAPGDYQIRARLHEGRDAVVRYVALAGGRFDGHLASAALGLYVGLWIALGTILLLEAMIKGNWMDGAVEQAR